MGMFDFIARLFGGGTPPRRQTGQPPMNVPPPRMADGRFVQSVNTSATTAGPPPVKTLDLDASQFTPISSKDALAAASTSKTVLNNPWWGRLDTIPPASDERTMLIDRTLVAYGLLAPDDLVEIHKIGDQMLEVSGVDVFLN